MGGAKRIGFRVGRPQNLKEQPAQRAVPFTMNDVVSQLNNHIDTKPQLMTNQEEIVYAIASLGMDKNGTPSISANNPILRHTRFSYYIFLHGCMLKLKNDVPLTSSRRNINVAMEHVITHIESIFSNNDCEQWYASCIDDY